MHDNSKYHKPFDRKLSFPYPSLFCECKVVYIHEHVVGKAVVCREARGYAIYKLERSQTEYNSPLLGQDFRCFETSSKVSQRIAATSR